MDERNNNEMTDDPMYHWERLQKTQREKMELLQEETERLQETQREKMKLLQEETKVHWDKLQETQRKKMKLLQEETDKIQKEKDRMDSVVDANISDDDIIEIDAGGRIIRVLRSTLTLFPDTLFSYMFSGRWEKSLKRNKDGRVFIDEDSQLIEIIINFLRMKKREDPSKPIESPKIPEEKKENFATLLDYYGLTDFFSLPLLDIDSIDVVQPHGSVVCVTKSENEIQFSKKNGADAEFQFLACKPPLNASGEGSFWKVTIDAYPTKSGLFLGIIGKLDATKHSWNDQTSCGWGGGKYIYGNYVGINGMDHDGLGGWSGEEFIEGECCYFHLKSNKLSMYCVQKNKTFTINFATTVDVYHIHFNIHNPGTKITLEPLNKIEWEKMM